MKKKLIYTGLIAMMLVFYSFVEPFLIEEKVIKVFNPDIPKPFNNVRVMFITDIHHDWFFSISRVKNLVRRINAQRPDLILLGGDYVEGSPNYIRPCFDALKKLQAPLGVFGVLGNHDHMEGALLTERWMKNAGIIELDNTAFWIKKAGARIRVGGVGYYSQDIEPTLNHVKTGDFVILASHNPDYAEQIKSKKIDVVLGGHNHGGQITFFGLWAPVIPSHFGQKFRSGVIQLPNTKVIVSNGIGTGFPPARFFARPQIVTLILKSR